MSLEKTKMKNFCPGMFLSFLLWSLPLCASRFWAGQSTNIHLMDPILLEVMAYWDF